MERDTTILEAEAGDSTNQRSDDDDDDENKCIKGNEIAVKSSTQDCFST
jgi:hypothetical protein